MTPCPSRRRELAELVDGSLDVRTAERLRAHLIGCPGCRAEAAELRRVRERLRAAAPDPSTSTELTDRLLSIAGEEAARPLYARPFDARAPGALPSSRRRTRRAVAGAVTMTCLLLVGLTGIGWAAAPPASTPALDPGPVVREEFAAVLGSGPLANPAVIVARATEQAEGKSGALISPDPATSPLSPAGAVELLERADEAPFRTSFAGRQVVQVRHLAGFWVAEADVEVRPGRGAHVTFPDQVGARRSALLPEGSPAGIGALAAGHEMLTAPGPRIAGRESVVVEARREGRVAARWWLDTDAGMVLWEQTFDGAGEVTLSAGFRTLTVGPMATPRSLPPRLAPRGTSATLTLASTDRLRRQGWLCSRRVARLDLVKVRTDRHDPMVHTVYGDGIVTLSVFQHKGALADAPAGFVWDPERKVYRSLGMTTMFSWQSGDSVFTIATDGPTELADQALAELPRAQPVLRSRINRVLDGWRVVLGVGS